MRMAPECAPCLLRRALYEADLVDPSRGREVMASALEILARRFPERPVSVDVATEVHRRTYAILRTDDPYAGHKRVATETARVLLPLARNLIREANDPLEAAVIASIAGNVLDFGIRGGLDSPRTFEGRFLEIYREGLAASDLPTIRRLLRPGAKIVLFTDNCGEILLDALLVEVLSGMGCTVTVVVKGAPMLSDATMKDAVDAGLDRLADAILTTGSDHVGFDPASLPAKVLDAVRGADLILSKGMGNFEAFTETDISPVAFLLRTKCRPVAEAAGAPIDVNAALLRK